MGEGGSLRAGAVAGWLAAGLTVVAVVLAFLGPSAPVGARAAERLQVVVDHQGWHAARWAAVAVVGLLQVPVWAAVALVAWRRRPGSAVTVAAFGVLASGFLAWGAWVQLTTVRGLADLVRDFPFDSVAQYRLFGADLSLASFGLGTVAFGALAWGVAGVAAWRGMKSSDRGIEVLAGSLLGLAGIAAVTGAVGFALDSSLLRGGLAIGAVLSVAAIGTTAAFLRGESRRLTVPDDRP